MSDGGPQFRTQFNTFCEDMGIDHQISSPYHPRSNGLAESAVKSCKKLIEKFQGIDTIRSALLEFRNTPRADTGRSPAQLMFGRRQRTALPSSDHLVSTTQQKKDDPTKCKFYIGDKVRTQNPRTGKWDSKGVIKGMSRSAKSYHIETEEDGTIWRNQRYIKTLKDAT